MAYTVVDKGSKYFDTSLYTGTGSSQSISNLNFQPDFTWIKGRSGATDHALYDAVRGIQKDLVSNATSAETTQTTGLTAFGSTGFTIGALAKLNTSSATYCSWNWLASNTSGSSNTSGTITSTVSANTTSGFSIVSYTGTGANATVGHGLGVAPAMIICKSRTQAQNWAVYHKSLGNTQAIFLDGTGAASTSASYWNNTSPTSTVFTVGNSGDVNYNAGTQISYCFADVKGFSKFGSYTGNGSTDGTFVYTGFKPAYVMVKASSTTGQWAICDNKRGAANILGNNGEFLFAENSDATNSAPANWDFLSNGFKARANYAAHNTSGVTYIYMAFAENPFVTSTQIPVTAR
jgi:hypothetical protein